jgi:O-6-methylguanine DNA methyltransferase
MQTTAAIQLPIATDDGVFVAGYSAKGLVSFDFPEPRTGRQPAAVPVPGQVARWHRLTMAALEKVLAGRAPGKLPPLDLAAGTPFQQRVWKALRRIQAGRTRSYGEIARSIGHPDAVRAVGGACGANPIPLFVPCHRVLAANRRLGGFSGGLDWKRKLLEREGVQVAG